MNTTNQQSNDTAGPAELADLDWVLTHVHQAIDELEFYNDEFKAFEKQRINANLIRALFEYDPHHLLILKKNGERAGFMISGPDNGVVFLYWSYILPAFRNSKLAIVGNTYFKEYFDNGNWHKLSTLTRTDNRTARIILKRFGWTEVAELKKHIFGEDYLVFEIETKKTIPGYRPFAVKGRLGRLTQRFKDAFGPKS
ncbi:GNAT family N-acetyltransferase [Maritalea porphyrae]|uniref:GNAT family N-acetyltransferase n=1 Tax=Maritalea porphyrae TaxID=880732 RepID=UPI0022AF1E0D|nr:GNAT family N-acetyltransferase [Maritalea porphyrae]MCZ4272652.1 hypothetical protein [Maritalea porphyrae]